MIIRIVQMSFVPEKTSLFLELFEERKSLIRNFDGCRHLELWNESGKENVYFTYSIWDSEEHLNHYRFSALFRDTWSKTKALFESKPQAWSVNRITEVSEK